MECNVLSLLSAGDLSGTEIPLFLKTIIATAAIYKINKVVLVIDKQILKKKTAIMPVDEEAIDSLLAKARETLNQIDCDKQVKSLLSSRWCYSDNFKEAKDASILVRECDCQISTQNWLDVFLSLTPLFYGKNLVINGQSGNIQARIALQIFASSETTIKKHFYFDSSFKNGLKKERADSAASCLRHPEAFEDYRNLDDEILPNSSRLQRSQETRTMILRVFKKNFRESLNDNDLTGALNLLEKQYRGIVSIPQKDVVLLHCYAATPHEIIASSLQNDVVNLPGGKKKYNIAAIQATLQALLTHLSYSYLQKSEKAAIDAITTYGYFFNIISHLNLDDPLNPLVLSSAPHLTNPYAPSYKEEIQALGKLKAVSKSFDWDSFHIMETYKHKHHENSRLLGNAVSSNAFNDLLEIYGSLFKSNFSFPLFSKFRSRILKQALNLQVDKYPCPVLTSEYTSPSFYNKEASCYYRTMEDEYFAVASLLFHLFFFGKNPYSYCTNAKDPNDKEANDYLLKNQYPPFAYNLKRSNKRIPKGIYGILWSHLPGFLKEDFVNEFTGTKVIATGQWLDDMKSYLHYLLDGRIAKVDPEANSILPESSLPYKLLALPRPRDERSSAVTGLVMKDVICEALLQLPSLPRSLSPFFWDPIVIALEHSPIYEGQYRNGKLTVRLEKNNGILKTVRAELTY
jgi:hypothetical protein